MHRYSGLLGWVAVTAAAFGISMAAVTLVGSSIGDPVVNPMSAEQVRRQLASGTVAPNATPTSAPTGPTTTTSPDPSRTPTHSESADGQPRVLGSDGGTVIATCAGGLVTLESWSPAIGFRVEHWDRGPATTAEVEFESNDDRYKLEISCRSGVPTVHTEHDDRGSNSGPDGGDDGGDGGGGSGPG
ncbi:MAG: hypothetical protein ACRDWG_20430 [Actinomycetes bacterium]